MAARQMNVLHAMTGAGYFGFTELENSSNGGTPHPKIWRFFCARNPSIDCEHSAPVYAGSRITQYPQGEYSGAPFGVFSSRHLTAVGVNLKEQMEVIMTNSTTRPAAQTPKTRNEFRSDHDWSGLPELIRRAMPRETGYNSETHKHRIAAKADEIEHLIGDMECVGTSLAMGISAIGQLMSAADHGKISDSTVYQIGDLLAMLGETINILWDESNGLEGAEPSE